MLKLKFELEIPIGDELYDFSDLIERDLNCIVEMYESLSDMAMHIEPSYDIKSLYIEYPSDIYGHYNYITMIIETENPDIIEYLKSYDEQSEHLIFGMEMHQPDHEVEIYKPNNNVLMLSKTQDHKIFKTIVRYLN